MEKQLENPAKKAAEKVVKVLSGEKLNDFNQDPEAQNKL